MYFISTPEFRTLPGFQYFGFGSSRYWLPDCQVEPLMYGPVPSTLVM